MKKKTKKKPQKLKPDTLYVRSENQEGVSDWNKVELPKTWGQFPELENVEITSTSNSTDGEKYPEFSYSIPNEQTVANYRELLDFAHAQIAALVDELELSIAAEQYAEHSADTLAKSLDECAILNDELRCDLEFAALRIEGHGQTIELKSEQIQTLKVYVEYLHESLRKTGKYLGATNQKSQDIWSSEWIRQGEVLRKELEAVDILV